MAKRTRGSGRPGQRRPTARPINRPAPRPDSGAAALDPAESLAVRPRPSSSLTPDEEARAAELEARIVAEERAAEDAARRSRDRARSSELGATRREAAPLVVRAAGEYAYVRRDIFRIARIGSILLLILAILHVLINVTHTIRV